MRAVKLGGRATVVAIVPVAVVCTLGACGGSSSGAPVGATLGPPADAVLTVVLQKDFGGPAVFIRDLVRVDPVFERRWTRARLVRVAGDACLHYVNHAPAEQVRRTVGSELGVSAHGTSVAQFIRVMRRDMCPE